MNGYYRFPAIHHGDVYFISEDDIWTVSASGGIPRRLTAGLGEMGKIAISPDGQWLAATAREERRPEVYIAPAEGGPLKRLTYFGADSTVRGFSPDGEILFSSNASQPLGRMYRMYRIAVDGGAPKQFPYGPATDIGFGPNGGLVLGRHTADPARWKRYRGGTAGRIWIDTAGEGQFHPLTQLDGNLASPMWIGSRIYFLSDHEGIGNIYSCNTEGEDLRRHTDHEEYFARWASTDGLHIAYQCGADLYTLDPQTGAVRKVEIAWRGSSTQTQRRHVSAERYLESVAVHPAGHSLAVECRGKPLTFALWEESVQQHGATDGVRYRLPQWLNDGATLVTVSDSSGEERLETFGPLAAPSLKELDLGRVAAMTPSPTSSLVAVTNHRQELLLVDVAAASMRRLDYSAYRPIDSVAWSPDGAWLAYPFSVSRETSAIKLVHIATGLAFLATTPEFRDFAPAFDPSGRYLYFLSHRTLDPVYDSYYFDLNFPRSIRPYLIILNRDEGSPFIAKPRGFGDKPRKAEAVEPAGPAAVRIDEDGIADRILAFPAADGVYRQIAGAGEKVFFTQFPISGSLRRDWLDTDTRGGDLQCFDFSTQKIETALSDVLSFVISRDGSTLVYRSGRRLRAVNASAKLEKPSDDIPSRQSGWIDLGRLRVSIDPRQEWRQMYRDIWRLQREFFWVEDMSGVDWLRVHERYQPLLDRVSTRAEFSDLIWEMQGELGTSHAYEFGGDHRPPPGVTQGYLGADFLFDSAEGCYRVAHVVSGDSWERDQNSPLRTPGVNLQEGDRLLAVRGRELSASVTPESQLVNFAGLPVELAVARADGSDMRRVTVTALSDETPARYREWVEANRRRVHEQTAGRSGYVHIPDMGPRGYSEFHRYYSLEAERDSLIIDVRYNGGGHVSSLILEKLARKRLGYDFSRWGAPVPYPPESVLGPMVAITNEHAGSDGDMFSHAFKMLKLGPLVGKRTWGGVIGISPRYRLVDGSVTTQPEYSFWFSDAGWTLENYGTDPDVEVEIAPQDYAAGRDPQLDKAIELLLEAMRENPPGLPEIVERPRLPLPTLPKKR
ncbi:MAG TPA: S41 family peptidase [Terriglobia bacterium]|nr:S41 family peptidase [Terriglobia bacterium]